MPVSLRNESKPPQTEEQKIMAANSFQNSTKTVAKAAVGVLAHEVVLPTVVTRDFDTEFGAPSGATVNARIGSLLNASDYADGFTEHGTAITRSAIVERNIAVTLDKLPYSAVPITSESQTLEIDDFGARVLTPQVRAVAERMESYLAAAFVAAPYAATNVLALDPAAPWDSIVDARAALNAANVPRGDRYLVVGASCESAILKDDSLVRPVNTSGTDSALREAEIGKLGGFTVIGSNAIDADTAYALHKSAFILATRAPVGPMGSPDTAGAAYGGLAATWAAQWNENLLQNESVVWSFAGVSPVLDGVGDAEMVRA
jgi:hypothetical protein